MRPPIDIGSVVISTAGRDAGRYFVVMALKDCDYALLCDGRLRRVEKPKLKKLKHIKPTRFICEYVAGKRPGEEIQNAQIRKYLSQNGFEPLSNQEE